MRLSNAEPGKPTQGVNFDLEGALAPWLWYGTATLDGTTGAWKEAPLGSLYICITASSVALYYKTSATAATASWHRLAGAGDTITGDVTFTGTVTAGDVVIST